MRRVYLDHNSTTPVDPRVAEAVRPYLAELFGNPSNLHSFGRECAEGLAGAREQVAGLIGAEPGEVYFTGSGSESDNWAVIGTVLRHQDRGRHIIASPVEHGAVLESVRYLCRRGFEATWLRVDEHGLVDPDEVRRAIRPDTILVTVMLANNEIGTLEPVAEIAAVCRERGVICHTDAVAAAGKTEINVAALGVDLLTISGHKLHAPKGVGALYIRDRVEIDPLIHGGHQERGMRAGTENVPGIVGLGKACELLAREWPDNAKRMRANRDRLEAGILARIPEVRRNGHPERRIPNTSHFSIAHVEGEALLLSLDLEGVALASGSACSAGTTGASPTLEAIGVPPLYRNSPLRFSLGPETTADDVDYTLDVLEAVVKRLRDISPTWRRA
ncbi:MAG TPA: cysteine desulfurase [candidate division WOR-3 bacterium]|uniref:cysteine desulfurase n=1 Tax=candidate division WOR-3 bacterium TaxID=2052148 RepID=A0A7V0XF50_UNCW3|nr:cysteine desulfurase [candidate division WOR-3 bacterium]